jgi:hypothetical protein
VLRALQRLAGTRFPADRPAAAAAAPSPAAAPQSWAVSPAVLGSPYAATGAGSPVSQPHRTHPPAAADAQQLQRAQQVGGVKRLGSMAAEAKEAFDALTEASTMLLEGGDYLIHSMAREEVERQLAAQKGCGWLACVHVVTHSGGVLRYLFLHISCDEAWTRFEVTVGHPPPPFCLPPCRVGAGGEEGGRGSDLGSSLARQLLQGAVGGVAVIAALDAAPMSEVTAAVPVDADEDIFAAEVDDKDEVDCKAEGHEEGDREEAGLMGLGQGMGRSSNVSSTSTAHVSGSESMAFRIGSMGGSGDGARENSMEGFQLDETTGWLYNNELGAFYDPHQRLWGDALSGMWYRFTAEGKYELVS